MNKTEVIKSVAKNSKLTQKDCELCLNALKHVILDALNKGENISFCGFGKFFVKSYKKRNSFNPQTGIISALKERKLPIFRASSSLKSKI